MPEERIPPQSLDAEQSLLGCVLIDKDAIIRIADSLTPEDFYKLGHQDIYKAMLELLASREPIDLLTLANRLNEKSILEAVGGRAYLIELTTAVPTAAHVENYAKIIQKKATLRRMTSAAADISKLGYQESDEVEELLDQAEQKLFSVSQKYIKRTFTPIKDTLDTAFERIDELHRERGKLRGIPSGFTDLD